MEHFYKPGAKLYFWNKKKKCLDYLIVKENRRGAGYIPYGFYFEHNGRTKYATYEYAEGKLFTSPSCVEQYVATIPVEHPNLPKPPKKKNKLPENYHEPAEVPRRIVDRDTYIEYGD